MTDNDIDHLRKWIGSEQKCVDTITPRLAASFNAIFDADSDIREGQVAPAAIHWCLAPEISPMSELGLDGHAARGGFLPPVPLPRRMWAGGKLKYNGEFIVGDTITKTSKVEDVVAKIGRTGPLVFVTVQHQYHANADLVLFERQDIVYRGKETTPEWPASEQSDGRPFEHDRQTCIEASATLLFRYSAITFNGHRIHYDQDYVTSDEGYPGLVFHGPLQASYLLRLARDEFEGATPREFTFKSVKPLFSGGKVTANVARGDDSRFWIADQFGETTMTATAAKPAKARPF